MEVVWSRAETSGRENEWECGGSEDQLWAPLWEGQPHQAQLTRYFLQRLVCPSKDGTTPLGLCLEGRDRKDFTV